MRLLALRRLLSFAAFATCLSAADDAKRSKPLPSYSVQVWQREQGLPQNSVTAIVQDRDGYLWLGTYDGLARFDGARFVTFDGLNTPAMGNGRITSLFSAKDGSVWIGHESGNVTQLKAGQFISCRAASNAPNQGIVGFFADAENRMWILGHNGTLECLADGRSLTPDDGIKDASPFLLFAPEAGGRLSIARDGLLSTFRDGKFVTHNLAQHEGDTGIYGLLASRKGGLWIVSEGQIRRWVDDRWVENWGQTPWDPQDAAAAMVELRNGALAVGTLNSGLYIISESEPPRHFDRQHGLPHDWIRSLYEDGEKNLWVGTGSGGLVALRESAFTTIDSPDGRNGRSVLTVAPSRDGGLWIGTEGAGLYHYGDGKWTHFGEDAGLTNGFVWSVVENLNREVWVGTWGGGLFQRKGTDRWVRDPRLEPTTPILALLQAPADNNLWIGTRSGLVHVNDGSIQHYGVESGLVSPDVRAIVQDETGTLWFGMVGGGLASLQDGALRHFDKKDGMSSAFVQSLLVDTNGVLWIGTTDGGLNRLKDGRFAVIGSAQGLPSNVIGHIADDGHGYLWLSTHNGLFRLAKSEANRCADGELTVVTGRHFGRTDGLPVLEFTGGQAAGCRTADGRLWFSTSAGVVTVNPPDVTTNAIPPRTVIEEMIVEGVLVPTSPTRLQIAPGRHHVEIKYTGLSFAAPEKVKFRYRLVGFEDDWLHAGAVRNVSYNYLPPGRYRFEVIACNNDGVWSTIAAAQSFTVLPFFWQTWWFRALAILVIVSTALMTGRFLTRRRMKQRVERAEQEHAVERERTRIARDIHDDLGASLTRITLLSQSARTELENRQRVASDLDQIFGTAREVTRALDEIVWAVNPKHDTLESLAAYLGKYAQDFLQRANVRCRLDFPIELPAWPLSAEIRHNLFLAFKEALNNILKHSGATEVRIALIPNRSEKKFDLIIEDDGRGFPSAATEPSGASATDRIVTGHGLANIQGRLAEIGGTYDVQSRTGRGTRTRMTVAVRHTSA